MASVISNPQANGIKQNFLFYQQQLQQQQAKNNQGSRFGKMDLSNPMIQRVAKAPSGCGSCGK